MRLTYGTYVATPDALDPEIDAAAAAGFDAVVFSEHHGMKGYVPDPLTAATYVLGRRSDLLAGPMPLLLPLHDPVAVAEAAALADALSGGRLVFGVAAGYLASEFEQRGIDLATRGGRLEEATTIVRRIWRGEPGGYTGDFYDLPPIDPLAQPPAQPGGPPILMACGTPAGLRRAARVADGIVLDSVRSPRAVAALARSYQDERNRLGRGRGKIAVMRRGWIGTVQESESFVAQLQAELSSFASKATGTSMPWLDEPDGLSLEAVRARTLSGDARAVVDQLETLASGALVDEVIVKVQWTSGTSLDVLTEQLGRWRDVCAARSPEGWRCGPQ